MHRASAHLRDRARDLRKSLTLSERRLWNWLRNRTFAGYKFRRQFPVAGSILDFYCAELKLAIEVDGQHHEQPGMLQYDDCRSARLEALGIRVIRIPNVLLAADAQLVAQQLRFAIQQRARE
jgi:very-short-patch-repair endonuclease